MKKYIFIAAAALVSMSAAAQETYENARLASENLNGTARYVGMGGAMEALGADISTMNTNPAGIGLFRHSNISGSFGLVAQHDGKSFANGHKTNMSFDQMGFVYSMRSGRNSYLNVGFNYHKSNNFDFILSASDKLSGASQNKLTYIKAKNNIFTSNNDATYSQLDHLYMNNLLKQKDGSYGYYDATSYDFNRANTGYIGEYDFNISGSINNRVYLGLTVGLHDVHYKGYSEYVEALQSNSENISSVGVSDSRKITGTGVDLKAGVIVRPIEDSPFRLGLYVQTPTWYDLTTENYTTMNNASIGESYDFKFYTPWKFGASIGHTVGNYLAFGATYEYADYSTCDIRINDGGNYDWDGSYYDSSSSDNVMNANINQTLKGVSTFKVGLELKPDPSFAVRLGYNYVSPMYNKNGYKDGTLNSPGSYYSSATDYTNWKSTNRITCGVGYKYDKFNFDLAYQYSQTDGDFTPFINYSGDKDATLDNICDGVKVSNKRSQVLFTLGYTF